MIMKSNEERNSAPKISEKCVTIDIKLYCRKAYWKTGGITLYTTEWNVKQIQYNKKTRNMLKNITKNRRKYEREI